MARCGNRRPVAGAYTLCAALGWPPGAPLLLPLSPPGSSTLAVAIWAPAGRGGLAPARLVRRDPPIIVSKPHPPGGAHRWTSPRGGVSRWADPLCHRQLGRDTR